MQLLTDASDVGVTPDVCSRDMMETVPVVMQFIRRHMRSLRGHELTVAQIRTLYFINLGRRPTLSDAADHIGLSLPAMSRLVDGLVKKGFVTRNACSHDRRNIRLDVTEQGQMALETAWRGTHAKLADEIATLSPEQRGTIQAAMRLLRPIFDPEGTG